MQKLVQLSISSIEIKEKENLVKNCWKLTYSSHQADHNFNDLWKAMEETGPTLIIAKPEHDVVLGAFIGSKFIKM